MKRETIGEAALVAFVAMFLLHDRGFAWYRTATGEAAAYDLDTPPGWFWWSMRNYSYPTDAQETDELAEMLDYMAWKVGDRRSRAARWP